MRTTLFVLCCIAIFSSCSKKPVQPVTDHLQMRFQEFNNLSAGQQMPRMIDVDGDGSGDILFSFMLVGDPLMQADKYQFYVTGAFNTFFPVNSQEEMPALARHTVIGAQSFSGYEWYNASSVLLAQRIQTSSQPPYWEGAWKDRSNTYFPFYILKDGEKYFGWFEISFDMATAKIILHRAAVSKLPGKAVKAGQQ